MNLQQTITLDGRELQPGYRKLEITNTDKLAFQYFTVCDQVAPQLWHVEVVLFGEVIAKTPSVPTQDQALREAEATIRQRLVRLLSA